MLSISGRNQQLNAFGTLFASAHSANPGDVGLNELAGGPYARKTITWGAASAAERIIATQPVLDIPAGGTVRFIGLWASLTSGVFLGACPVDGDERNYIVHSGLIQATSVDPADNQAVTFTGFAPPELVVGDIYYARDIDRDTFAVAATPGGAAIGISQPTAYGRVSKVTEHTFAAAGKLSVTRFTLDMRAFVQNTPPEWDVPETPSVLSGPVGQQFDLKTWGLDMDGDPLVFEVDPTSSLGGLATLTSNGIVEFTQAGTIVVKIRAREQ